MICPNCGHHADRHDDGFGCTRRGCPCVWDRRERNADMWSTDPESVPAYTAGPFGDSLKDEGESE